MSFHHKLVATYLPFLILIGCSLLYLFQFLRYPAFNLIDDGFNLQKAAQLKNEISISNWSSNLVEKPVGRLRPVYFLYFYVLSLISTQPAVFWWFQWSVLSFLLCALFVLIRKTTHHSVLTMIVCICVLALNSLAENLFRLGTAELRQALLVVVFIGLMLRELPQPQKLSNIFLGLVILWLAFLTKETSIFLVPLYMLIKIIQSIFDRRISRLTILSMFLVSASTILFLHVMPERTGYASSYTFSFRQVLDNVFVIRAATPEIFWLGIIALLGTVLRLFFSDYSLKYLWDKNQELVIVCSVIVCSLVIQLPWLYQFERYFLITHIFILWYVALELQRTWDFLKSKQLPTLFDKSKFLISFGALAFLVSQFLFLPGAWRLDKVVMRSRQAESTWFSQYHYSYQVIKAISNLPINSTIFIAFNDYEVVYELGLFATHLGNRPLSIVSENHQVELDFGTPYKTVLDIHEAYSNEPKQKYLITRGESNVSQSAHLSQELWPEPPMIERDPKLVWRIWQ